MIKRAALIIHYQNPRALNEIDRNLVHVYYRSDKSGYAVLYYDFERKQQVMTMLKKINSILEIDDSKFETEKHVF